MEEQLEDIEGLEVLDTSHEQECRCHENCRGPPPAPDFFTSSSSWPASFSEEDEIGGDMEEELEDIEASEILDISHGPPGLCTCVECLPLWWVCAFLCGSTMNYCRVLTMVALLSIYLMRRSDS